MVPVCSKNKAAADNPKDNHYAGPTRNGRANGTGRYVTKEGMVYEGGFEDDLYHGVGQIIYPDGTLFKGTWDHGKLSSGHLVFPDGLIYDGGLPGSGLADANKPWGYCDGNDRRFWKEIQNDLSGKPSLVANPPAPVIPENTMDVGHGYYDIVSHKVYHYDGTFMRNVDLSEHFWIISTCRKGWVEEIGRSPTTHF
ncbi:MORN repeat-containing protein 5-like [Paramacrobiotus metropolitanus]|uniref:MORN repeat-containing protein 5-like n=1 Tax=Paramacrobiotus metropolitanus TaxID=2943436 RepID=UPI0024458236|nr:MORN repeat-containing protein 5-like [Paramacrobiotus metropolitanus]